MSPSSFAACSVMPTVATSPSRLSHSCSSVYFSIRPPDWSLATLVLRHDKWQRRDGDRQALAAQLGKDPCSGHCERGRQIAHRDRRIEARTEAARSHLTYRSAFVLAG